MSDSNQEGGTAAVEETALPPDDGRKTASTKKLKPDGDAIAEIGDEVGGPA